MHSLAQPLWKRLAMSIPGTCFICSSASFEVFFLNQLFSTCVAICTCGTRASRDEKRESGVLLCHSPTYSCKAGSLTKSRAKMAGEQAPMILLSPPPNALELQAHRTMPSFSGMFWWCELRFSCLLGRCSYPLGHRHTPSLHFSKGQVWKVLHLNFL